MISSEEWGGYVTHKCGSVAHGLNRREVYKFYSSIFLRVQLKGSIHILNTDMMYSIHTKLIDNGFL